MHAVGQAEVVVLLQCLPDEKTFPRDIFTHFIQLYRDALTGKQGLLWVYIVTCILLCCVLCFIFSSGFAVLYLYYISFIIKLLPNTLTFASTVNVRLFFYFTVCKSAVLFISPLIVGEWLFSNSPLNVSCAQEKF